MYRLLLRPMCLSSRRMKELIVCGADLSSTACCLQTFCNGPVKEWHVVIRNCTRCCSLTSRYGACLGSCIWDGENKRFWRRRWSSSGFRCYGRALWKENVVVQFCGLFWHRQVEYVLWTSLAIEGLEIWPGDLLHKSRIPITQCTMRHHIMRHCDPTNSNIPKSVQAKLMPATGSGELGRRAYMYVSVKHSMNFFRWGTTTDISLTSSRTGPSPFSTWPFLPFVGCLIGSSKSRRRFLEAGSELTSEAAVDAVERLRMWVDILLNSSSNAVP